MSYIAVYLLDQYCQQIYLVWHPKRLCYLPPGGKVESGETPIQAAIREVFEETGYPITDLVLWLVSITQDQHTNFIFLATVCTHAPHKQGELDGQWFQLQDTHQFKTLADVYLQLQVLSEKL
jgi:8-oxo-dGTP pyrophosphatase MutT (NUDIX family)